MNTIDLSQRHIAVTGAAQGIGFAVARRALASGASVTIWDRDAELAAQTVDTLVEEGKVDFVAVDVSDHDQVRAAVSQTLDRHDRIDGLVNNAGIAGVTVPIVDYPADEWKTIMDVNLLGPFLTLRETLPSMIEQNYGRIVNVCSIAGKEGNPNAAAYSASKAGLIALTKSAAKEVADKDIAVNCVTPAAAKTKIFDQISQTHIDYMLSKIPRGRFLQVDEAAAMIVWMLSEENSFTTGAAFDLSGGRATY